MSHEAYHWALRQDVPPTERFVLSILADRSNHEGVSWPGYNNLAALTGYTTRTLKRAVAALEERGLLEIEARRTEGGRTTSNLYRLRLDRGRTLLEIVTREQRWRDERTGQQVLFPAEETPVGEGDTRSPSPESDGASPVDNPVHQTPELSTRVTEDHPQGDRVSPTEGDRGSPLELEINQDPLIQGSTTATSSAVDEKDTGLSAGDAIAQGAPDGAPGTVADDDAPAPPSTLAEEVRQHEDGEGDQRSAAEAHFALVDAAFRRRFGAAWTKRSSGARRDVWLSVLASMSAAQVGHGIAEASKPSNQAPPSAYAFATLALPRPPQDPPAGPPPWPPASRDVGHAAAARIRRMLGS